MIRNYWKRAAHLAGSLAERLSSGEYLVRPDPQPVFFIKIRDWHNNIEITDIDLTTDYYIELSEGTRVEFDESQVNDNLKDQDQIRIVVLAENRFTSFKINVDEESESK